MWTLLRDFKAVGRLIRRPGALSGLAGAGGILRQNARLFEGFLAGGVVVWGPPIDVSDTRTAGSGSPEDERPTHFYSVVQLDGDIVLKVSNRFTRLPKHRQQRELQRHIKDIDDRLAPIGELRDLLIAAMMTGGLGFFATGLVGTLVAIVTEFAWIDLAWLALPGVGVTLVAAARPIVARIIVVTLKRRFAVPTRP
jgi:hypothetical protein